jgi:hypothetical protein
MAGHMEQQALDNSSYLRRELLEQSLGEDRHMIGDKRCLVVAIPTIRKNKLDNISQYQESDS